jgi:DNA repair protein RadC
LGRRIHLGEIKSPVIPSVTNAKEVLKQIPALLKDREQEVFIIICVNQRNQITYHEEIGRGGITSCLVDIRIALRIALERAALGLILLHNHPGGTAEPSRADIMTTRKLKAAAATMDIGVLDHLIFCGKTWFSFAEHGLMSP